MLPCMPVTWKYGTTAITHSSWYTRVHCGPATVVNITLRWRWTQPLGAPVVPEVYGITHRSSGPARCGPGAAPDASASLHEVTPFDCVGSGCRGAVIQPGTSSSVGAFW